MSCILYQRWEENQWTDSSSFITTRTELCRAGTALSLKSMLSAEKVCNQLFWRMVNLTKPQQFYVGKIFILIPRKTLMNEHYAAERTVPGELKISMQKDLTAKALLRLSRYSY